MRRVFAGIGLVSVLWASSTSALAAWPQQFADVDTWPAWGIMAQRYSTGDYGAWGGDLAEAVWFELMVGDPPEGHPTALRMFRPYDTITRAEFATVLARALGIDDQSDMGPEWFRPTVETLQRAGIITTSGAFRVPITRREMGDWVGRALEWYGVDLAGRPEINFSDIDGLPEAHYIRLATKANVIKGYPDGTYGPERTATRAEAAALALRLAKQLKKNPPGPEVFEEHFREHMAAITQGEKEVLQGKPYDHSHLLEPYLSEMAIYGRGGYDIGAQFAFSFLEVKGYRELVGFEVEPVLLRDTVAVVRVTSTICLTAPDGTRIGMDSRSEYLYYAKRNGRWLGTNFMEDIELHGHPPVEDSSL